MFFVMELFCANWSTKLLLEVWKKIAEKGTNFQLMENVQRLSKIYNKKTFVKCQESLNMKRKLFLKNMWGGNNIFRQRKYPFEIQNFIEIENVSEHFFLDSRTQFANMGFLIKKFSRLPICSNGAIWDR